MAQRQQAKHRNDRTELVKMKLRGDLEAEHLTARDAAAQALVATGKALPGDDDAIEKHLERQRDEGEVVRAQPYTYGADAERSKGRDGHRKHGYERQWEVRQLHYQCKGIGAKTVEHAVTERDHACIADEQVQRSRKERHRTQADDKVLKRGAAMDERNRQDGDEDNSGDRRIA